MRVAYCGNFQPSVRAEDRFSTEWHIAQTLRGLGHVVIQIQENGVHPSRVLGQCEEADLFLFTRTWGQTINMDHIRGLRAAGIPSASLHLDLYVGLRRQAQIEGDAFWATDYVFTPDGSSEAAEFFASKGINHHYLKPGVFKPECGDGKPRPELAHEVAFVGGGANYGHPEWPYRRQLVKWLQQSYGARYGKYGYPEPTMRGQDLNDLYASATVVVGDSVCIDFTKEHYWSDRVYETIGRGGFLIMPYIIGLEEEFTDGETIVFYQFGDLDELRRKIDYYIEHEDERERIRKAGQVYVREHATYHNRLKQLLAVVFPPAESSRAQDAFRYGLHHDEELRLV
jgi:hypothetical protein